MNKSASKKAMARTRARRMALSHEDAAAIEAPEQLEAAATDIPPDDANLDTPSFDEADYITAPPLEVSEEAAVEVDEAVEGTLDELQQQVRSPPVLMLVVDEEEEVEFCAPEVANDVAETAPSAPTDEPPFDPPDLEELLSEVVEDEEEPPFDPMEAEELAPPSLSVPIASTDELLLTRANENGRGVPLGPVRHALPEGAHQHPAPAIRIHFSWDRKETAEFFERVAADSRLSRTEITIERGGLDGAAVRCAAHQRPDLVVIDSNLRGASMLASVDRLMHAAANQTRVIVLGAVNDVTLLRELAQRGVDDYLIWPVTPEDVAGAACAMFAGVDKARVIAVIGARGGIGSSTIAHNLAWSIAERQRARVTLVDLDLPFGAAAFNFKLEPKQSLGDILDANDVLNDVALERIAIKRTERLTILPAPASPRRSSDLQEDTAQALIAAARRLSSYVVLDLPHLWEPWVKQALLGADEVVLVSCPDIASLRNTDNIAKRLKDERDGEPVVVLSMVGVPKRPEVPIKEFAEALAIQPACTLAFEPNVFGAAMITGQMIGEVAPESKAAALLDRLATLLTGRDPIETLRPEPPIFDEPLPAEETNAVEESADPFETALVNPYALLSMEDEPEQAPLATPASVELAPLELLELAWIEPDYIARARAAALDELDAIESQRRPERRPMFGPFVSVAAGFTVTALAVGAYLFMQLEAAPVPAPASASATAPIQASAPPPPPSPQQMAADYENAMRLLELDAAHEAVARLRRLADAGFPMAQYRLAKLYESGEGVGADLVQARQWTERAANAGNRQAIHDLGVYYARGEGAPRDEAAAFRLFQQAAELDYADSQFNLGVLYEQGRGVEANPGEALFWYMLAARQGDEAADERVAALRLQLPDYEIEQATVRIAAFQPTPADPVANGVFAPPAAEARESAETEGAESAEILAVPAAPSGG
ncbi:MAG TPA: AAA family ATPase [Candidatus Binatia bacterium]|nr:AAA family ATPase [Candidatus Binatia bacterium]